jgi:alpha-glucosidase
VRAGLLAIVLLSAGPLHAVWQGQVDSPDGKLRAEIGLDDGGRPWYQLFREGAPIIQRSPLGLSLHNTQLTEELSVVAETPETPLSDAYTMRVGKQREIEYRANERTVTLRNDDGQGMVVRLRLSNDGLAYRYELLGESLDPRIVTSEESGAHFFPGTKAWLQPKAEAQSGWSRTNPSYEEDYHQEIDAGTPSPTAAGWVYPALFRYGDTWIVLSETGMDGHYCGSGLAQQSPDGLYRVQFPQPGEVTTDGKRLPEARLPFHSPWRLVLAGSLETIAESTLGTDLADPSLLPAIDFARPGISAWSWGVLKDDATVYPVQKEFVDYASEMSWPYVLVDADWDQKIGYDKLAELARYAAQRGVGLLVWFNSSGDWNETVYSPKSRLLTRADRRMEFARLQAMGIRGVKVDFFPGDGLSVVQYYRDILADAAEFDLMVNFHGATLPRGLERTFPNLMTMEAVKGFEFVTFTQESADQEATHAAMLPFTRNLFDPMDFTPMVLGDIPNIERRTSNGFELALSVLFTSGIQHLVTTPEQMEAVPEFVRDYLRRLPVEWDESRFLAGYPGRYVVFARRSGERWYVAGINAEAEPKGFELDLSVLPVGKGSLITDGEKPRELVLAEVSPPQGQGARQEITVAPSSGFVMVFSKAPGVAEEWLGYDAQESDVRDMSGTPRIQRFTWNEDGTPNFGTPASESMELAVPSR